MGRTVALLGLCALTAGLFGCGGDAGAAAAAPLSGAGVANATAAAGAPLVGRARTAEDAGEPAKAPALEPPMARVVAGGHIEVPDDALWVSVTDALCAIAGARRAVEHLPKDAPVEVAMPGGAGRVLVDGTPPPGSAGLHLTLKPGTSPTMDIVALGAAWVAENGCEAPSTWTADAWVLQTWKERLHALDRLDFDGKRSVRVQARGDVPAATVLEFLAAVDAAGLGPTLIETRRRPRLNDGVTATGCWLARHQMPTGAWDDELALGYCDGQRMRHQPVRGDPVQAENAGLTGLGLLAFLGAGYTHRGKHPFKATVSKGLRHLKTIQRPDGRFPAARGWDTGVAHAVASLAMLEAYGMTASPIFKGSAQRALTALRGAYLDSRDAELSLVYTAMALKSALLINEDAVRRDRQPPLVVDETLCDLLLRHVDGTALDTADLPAASALVTRTLLEKDAYRADDVEAGALQLANAFAARKGASDPVLTWLATLATFRVNRKPWKIMKRVLLQTSIDEQRTDGHTCCAKGSWDPHPGSALPGGRVAATALHALCLEVFYRYDRVFGVR